MEIKSKQKIIQADAKALDLLVPDIDKSAEHFLLSMDPLEACFGKTQAMSWQKGLKRLFGG